MLKSLYEKIRQDAAPSVMKIDGRDYSDKSLCPVRFPTPEPLSVTTLSGLVDYLNNQIDELRQDKIFCHVSRQTLWRSNQP